MMIFWWQLEIKRGPCIGFAFSPDLAAMPGQDALDNGQAHPRSPVFRPGMHAFENAE